MSGKQVSNQYNQKHDFVSKVNPYNGALLWNNNLSEGKGSSGDLLDVHDSLIIFFNHDYQHNGNNGQYYFIFDASTGNFSKYSHNTPFPNEFKMLNGIGYVEEEILTELLLHIHIIYPLVVVRQMVVKIILVIPITQAQAMEILFFLMVKWLDIITTATERDQQDQI